MLDTVWVPVKASKAFYGGAASLVLTEDTVTRYPTLEYIFAPLLVALTACPSGQWYVLERLHHSHKGSFIPAFDYDVLVLIGVPMHEVQLDFVLVLGILGVFYWSQLDH